MEHKISQYFRLWRSNGTDRRRGVPGKHVILQDEPVSYPPSRPGCLFAHPSGFEDLVLVRVSVKRLAGDADPRTSLDGMWAKKQRYVSVRYR